MPPAEIRPRARRIAPGPRWPSPDVQTVGRGPTRIEHEADGDKEPGPPRTIDWIAPSASSAVSAPKGRTPRRRRTRGGSTSSSMRPSASPRRAPVSISTWRMAASLRPARLLSRSQTSSSRRKSPSRRRGRLPRAALAASSGPWGSRAPRPRRPTTRRTTAGRDIGCARWQAPTAQQVCDERLDVLSFDLSRHLGHACSRRNLSRARTDAE
jgi:hypothetical protein